MPSSPESGGAPLDGVRVVDLSRVLAGPYATMVLADLGADVVKVERPGEGDETRSWGPPYAGGEAAYFLAVNRGKRSVAVDLKHPEGLALALELSAAADVVIENFRPGAAARLGLNAAAIHARNSRVVYCSITGFGRREPRDRPGYDFIVQAESGLMSITGEPDVPPTKIGVALVDVLTGLNAAVAILAALRRRDLGGTGERIEISLLDSALAALVNVAQNALVMGEEPPRYGNAHPSIVPYQPFAASDGWIAVAAANDSLFARLCEALVRPELATDKRFSTNAARVLHRDALLPLLEETFATGLPTTGSRPSTPPACPSGRSAACGRASHRRAGDGAREPPRGGRARAVAPPLCFESSAPPAAAPPPLLGQHTREVLAELGVDDARLAALEEAGVVATAET